MSIKVAEKWIKKYYTPICSKDRALPDRTRPKCIFIADECYEISSSDYNHYLKLRSKNENFKI